MTVHAALDVVREARKWLGTPYAHQHRELGIGVDCAGVLIGTARGLGIVSPEFDVNGYASRPDGDRLLDACDLWMERVPMSSMRPGHALVLRFGEEPQHIGIVGDYWHDKTKLTLIHAWSLARPKPCVVEHRMIFTKLMTPLQAYALPGVSY